MGDESAKKSEKKTKKKGFIEEYEVIWEMEGANSCSSEVHY